MIFLSNNGWWYEDITVTTSGHFLETQKTFAIDHMQPVHFAAGFIP
jgi:hypothetical protein